jgi:predicted dehydrogenase
VEKGQPAPVKGEAEPVEFAKDEPLRLECQAFLHAIATRVPPLTDGRSGLRVLQTLGAAQRSLMLNGEPVTLAAN